MNHDSSSHPVIDGTVRALSKILWSYHNLDQEISEAVDLILVAGSHDDRVAEYGAQLALKVSSRFVVASGGFGKITAEVGGEPEAVRFRRIMESRGVPEGLILCEDRSSNMGENIQFTHKLIDEQQPASPVARAVVVTKPYMKRRAVATALKQWPGVEWVSAGPDLSFEEYASADVPERRMIELMVGDTQRIETYATKGFQVPQEIPSAVTEAFERLVDLGFTRFVER
ncbi:YdcF family protein [Streptomyces sp. NPDC048489]|uniref:YdcF family protein n=1 Tax=Streptomyces sp. NPDC048489 TaxID=3154504 RepID=UPI00341C88E5